MSSNNTGVRVTIAVETKDDKGSCIKVYRLRNPVALQQIASVLKCVCINVGLTLEWLGYQDIEYKSVYHSRKRLKFNNDYFFLMINNQWYVYTGSNYVNGSEKVVNYVKPLDAIIHNQNVSSSMYI